MPDTKYLNDKVAYCAICGGKFIKDHDEDELCSACRETLSVFHPAEDDYEEFFEDPDSFFDYL